MREGCGVRVVVMLGVLKSSGPISDPTGDGKRWPASL